MSKLMRKSILLVFAIALGARTVVSLLQITQGIHPISWLPTLPMWSDFYDVYGHQLKLLAEGFIPYRDFAYSYTPLFLFSLLPTYLVGGIFAASIPMIFSDALSAPLIYEIISLRSGSRIALSGGLAYALMPLVLIDVGYLWLGSQPVTFFVLLSIYYILREKPLAASALLGVAVLFQQEALFVLPVLVIWQIKKFGKAAWRGLLLFSVIVLAVSAPFLLISTQQYVVSTSYGFLANWFVGNSPYLVPYSTSSVVTLAASSHLGPCPATVSLLNSLPFACIRYSNPILTIWVDSVTWLSGIIVFPLLILLVPALWVSRKKDTMTLILASYSMVAFIVLFSFSVHTALSYYFIPVYALLLSASRTRISVLSTSLFASLSLSVPTGPFLGILPLLAMMSIVILQEKLS